MIARIFILLLIGILLPDLYLHARYLRRKQRLLWLKRLALWLPSVVMTAATIILACERNFAPSNIVLLYIYLILLGVIVAPKFIYAGCSFAGKLLCKRMKCRKNWGSRIGFVLALLCVLFVAYGWTIGANQLKITRVQIHSPQLPKAFDGYRIVHFSDAHVGSFIGNRRELLQRAIDSINAQHADAIVFTGDLQNIQPSEIVPVQSMLASLKAKDGVFSVLGNHDYSMYVNAPEDVKRNIEREMIERQKQMGWQLLLNGHRILRRGSDSIVIAGTENDGRPPYPSRADLSRALAGINPNSYVVLLQHDPASWRRNILPHSNVQLTLCGHTHGGQINILGLRPTLITYHEDKGLYSDGNRQLFISSGLGGLIPFRFDVPPEVVVIELKRG